MMSSSLKRVNALFIKELRDFVRNPNVLIMLVLPLVFAILYGRMMNGVLPGEYALGICLLISLSMIGCMVPAMIIAEEKEKNTLRTLLLSPLSPLEFLTGKALISLFICMATNVIVYFIIPPTGIGVFYYIVIAFLSSVASIFLGAVIGLISKNQMETGIIGFPVYMLMLMTPIFANINSTFKHIADFCYTYHSVVAINKICRGQGFLATKVSLLVIIAWIMISAVLFILTCRKVKLDK